MTNRGNANATEVKVTDAIPPKLVSPTFTTTKGTISYDPGTRLLTVDIGTLAPGESVSIGISGVTQQAGSEPLPYLITNFGTIYFKEGAPRQSNVVTVEVYAPPTDIPEPGTWLLLGSGLAGLAGYAQMRVRARRKRT